MKVGSKPHTQVTIEKIKNERPTVIKVFGGRYVLDMTNVSNRRVKK